MKTKAMHALLLAAAIALPVAAQKKVGSSGATPAEEPARLTMSEMTMDSVDTQSRGFNQGAEALAFDGEHIWIAGQFTGKVHKVRASDMSVAGSFAVGANPVAIIWDGSSIWIANLESDNIMRLAPDGAVRQTIAVGDGPGRLLFDGAHVWVTNRNDRTLVKVRAHDGAILGKYETKARPVGLAFDGTHIWVANNLADSVTKYRAIDGTNLGTFAVGRGPFDVAFDNVYVWVTNFFDGTVTRLTPDGKIVDTIDVGDGAAGIIVDRKSTVWVASSGINTIMQLDAASGQLVAKLATGEGPFGGVYDGSRLWIANWGGNSISVAHPPQVEAAP